MGLNSGRDLLSTAAMAVGVSSDCSAAAFQSALYSSPSRIVWSCEKLSRCFVPRVATGDFAADADQRWLHARVGREDAQAITRPISSAFAITSFCPPWTTWPLDASPKATASSVPKSRLVNASSLSNESLPVARGSRWSVPMSAARPASTSLMLNRQSVAIRRTSQAEMMSMPRP